MLMAGVCMFVPFFSFFLFYFFFLVKEKERKEKERTTVAAIPSHQFSISAVDGFPSPKKMTWIVMSSLFVSQSVSSVLSLTTCYKSAKKAIRQKKTKKTKKTHLTRLENGGCAIIAPRDRSSSPPPNAFLARCVAAFSSTTTKDFGSARRWPV